MLMWLFAMYSKVETTLTWTSPVPCYVEMIKRLEASIESYEPSESV